LATKGHLSAEGTELNRSSMGGKVAAAMPLEETTLGSYDEKEIESKESGSDVASEGNQWRDTDEGFLPEDEPREWLFCTRVPGCDGGSHGTGFDFDAEYADTTVRSRLRNGWNNLILSVHFFCLRWVLPLFSLVAFAGGRGPWRD